MARTLDVKNLLSLQIQDAATKRNRTQSWKDNCFAVIGDSRAKALATPMDTFLPNLKVHTRSGTTWAQTSHMVQELLDNDTQQSTIVLVISMHCDITRIQQNLMICVQVNLKRYMERVVTDILRWQEKYPHCTFLVPIPFEPDFIRYNAPVRQNLSSTYRRNHQDRQFQVQYQGMVKELMNQWLHCIRELPFDMHRVCHWQRFAFTNDGLHPSPVGAGKFWPYLRRFTKRFLSGSSQGKWHLRTHVALSQVTQSRLTKEHQNRGQLYSLQTRVEGATGQIFHREETRIQPSYQLSRSGEGLEIKTENIEIIEKWSDIDKDEVTQALVPTSGLNRPITLPQRQHQNLSGITTRIGQVSINSTIQAMSEAFGQVIGARAAQLFYQGLQNVNWSEQFGLTSSQPESEN